MVLIAKAGSGRTLIFIMQHSLCVMPMKTEIFVSKPVGEHEWIYFNPFIPPLQASKWKTACAGCHLILRLAKHESSPAKADLAALSKSQPSPRYPVNWIYLNQSR